MRLNQGEDPSVNEYPFITEEFGKLPLNEKVLKGYLFNLVGGTYIFTIEEKKIISIYIIKSYSSTNQKGSQGVYAKQQQQQPTKISNFKMAKRASLELEY